MRKATLLIAVLLCFGLATAFAGPVQVEPEYEAEASATWGVQLDEMSSGFQNSAESTIMFTFIEEQTAEYGEGTTYGYIEVEDFEVEFEANGVDNGTGAQGPTAQDANDGFSIALGEITAKVFLGPAYIVLYDGADDAVDEAFGAVEIAGDIIPASQTVGIDPDVAQDPTTEYGGVAVGFEVPDLVTLELGVASRWDWNDTPAQPNNEKNAYVWSIMADVTPVENVGVVLYSNMWHGLGGARDEDGDYINPTPGTPGNPAAVGLSASYDLMLSDDMMLTPSVAFDMATEQDAQEDQEMRWEAGLGLNLLWPGLGVEDSDEDFLGLEDQEVTSGVGFEVVYGSHPTDSVATGVDSFAATQQAPVLLGATSDEDLAVNTLAFKLGFYEDGGDDGFLPIVGAALLMNYNMVLANDEDALVAANAAFEDGWADFGIGVEFDADLGVVTPYAGVISESYNVTGNDNFYSGDTATTMFLNVGTDIDVIPNTTFTIDYASGDLLYDSIDDKGQGADPTYGDVYGDAFGAGTFSAAKAGQFSISTEVSF